MMHYRKGECVEQELTKADLPFKDCMPQGTEDFLWMHVKSGTKLSNVISFAKNALDTQKHRTIVWSGSDCGLVKTVSCAEMIKRDYPLYQVTRMGYKNVEEHWMPQMDGLDELVANRQVPCIHILMSLDSIDDSIAGLQKPNTKTDYWVTKEEEEELAAQRARPHYSGGSSRSQYRVQPVPDRNQPARRPPPKPSTQQQQQPGQTPRQTPRQQPRQQREQHKGKQQQQQQQPKQRQQDGHEPQAEQLAGETVKRAKKPRNRPQKSTRPNQAATEPKSDATTSRTSARRAPPEAALQ